MQENNIDPKITELLEKIHKKDAKPTMSVMEMGKMLGLQKTDSYWLVNKRFFKTVQVNGKTRVDMESFNRWYDSQVKYQIVGGRPPGSLLRELSFSPKEMADELGISEAYVYEVIDQYNMLLPLKSEFFLQCIDNLNIRRQPAYRIDLLRQKPPGRFMLNQMKTPLLQPAQITMHD